MSFIFSSQKWLTVSPTPGEMAVVIFPSLLFVIQELGGNNLGDFPNAVGFQNQLPISVSVAW